MKIAAIYARVSSEKQKDENTIASQTAALVEFAANNDFSVSVDSIIEDAGFSGATLVRPGLEKLRDLAAEGQIQAVLIHSPDRLSRKYAYQVLLTEELARHGVETVFLKAPQTATPEDHLMVQFQGMIAEYERAQILERSRRGKRHRAQQGQVSVLSGAPYGYRYVRKTDDSAAYYEVIEAEAAVVRMVYERYTTGGISIGAITRLLNDRGVPTRKKTTRWERSVTWAMLRNPAYKGTAYFGKTKIAQRQRITRPLRLRGGIAQRNSANHERPQSEWIEIAVPAIVSEEAFALAQDLLQTNRERSPRRTIAPSIVQGLVSCKKCGYALSRTSTRSSARVIHYYRCIGSDAYRHLGGSLCDNRPVRQDLLDEVVWREVIRLLEDPTLINEELERRLAAAKDAAPSKRREETLNRELVRLQKSIERLTTAYQEDLLSLDELRQRLPALRQREGANRAELQSITDQIATRAAYLRLAQTLTAFLNRLRESADTLDVAERQRIVRLVVKEVLVVDDTIVIRHSIPVPGGAPDGTEQTPPTAGAQRATPAASAQPATVAASLQPAAPARAQPVQSESYLLRSGRHDSALRRADDRCTRYPIFHHSGFQPFADQADDTSVTDA